MMGRCTIPSKHVKVAGGRSATADVVKALKNTGKTDQYGRVVSQHTTYIRTKAQLEALKQLCLKEGKSYCGMFARAVRITGLAKVAARTAIRRSNKPDCTTLSPRERRVAIKKARWIFCQAIDPVNCVKTTPKTSVNHR